MLAKRFNVELPPEDDEGDDEADDDGTVFELDREAEQPAAMEPVR